MPNAILKPVAGRQYPLHAEVAFDFTQINDTAVAVPAIKLPYGAQIISGAVIVDVAFNAATSSVLDVGDSTTPNRYVNDVNLKVVGRTPLVPTGYVSDGADLQILPVTSGTNTAGSGRVQIQYVIANRAHEAQTN